MSERRVGCGGSAQGVCTTCEAGRYEMPHETGVARCPACEVCPASPEETAGGLTLPADAALRVGCGGESPGACVRFAMGFTDDFETLERCPSVAAPSALCQGTRMGVRFALGGVSADQLSTSAADCSAGQACLSGLFSASLWRRTVASPGGVKVATLREWWPEELTSSLLGAPSAAPFVATVQLPPLPAGLSGGAGYFVRVTFTDHGGGCCAATAESPFSGDSADFAVDEPESAAAVALASATPAILAGDRDAAVTSLSPLCADTAADAALAGCELAKALNMGLMMGTDVPMASPLDRSAVTVELAVRAAVLPVAAARQLLRQWEEVQQTLLPAGGGGALPLTHGVWSGTVAPLVAPPPSPANETELRASSPLRPLTLQVLTAAHVAQQADTLWREEASQTALELGRVLADLQSVDRYLGDALTNADFDAVRAGQQVTWRLWQDLEDGPPDGISLHAWFHGAFERIGSTAWILLGTWGSTWRNSAEWKLEAEVGDALAWPPTGLQHGFGGVPANLDMVPLSRTRQRLWQPFRDAAQAWLARWAAEYTPLAAERATGASLPDAAALVPAVVDALAFVEALTEKFLVPLQQPTAQLLAGGLPSLALCGAGRRCLTETISRFSQASAVFSAFLGLGPRAVRPWLDPSSEEMRLRRAAEEVVSLLQGRAKLLEAMLLAMLDARSLQREPSITQAVASSTNGVASHLDALAVPADPADPLEAASAEWRWREVMGPMKVSLEEGHATLRRLARRRLSQLEDLCRWAGERDWGGAALAWKRPWPLDTGDAAALEAAELAASNELTRAVNSAAGRTETTGTGYLRVEATTERRPIAFAGMQRTPTPYNPAIGVGLFYFETPYRFASTMHTEAQAFLISAGDVNMPLEPIDVTIDGTDLNYADPRHSPQAGVPHVELTLRRLTSGLGEPARPAGEASYLTLHMRKDCGALNAPSADVSIGATGGALQQLNGFWVLEAKDGLTGKALSIEEGTAVRLLFKVDVPGGEPPWEVIEGSPDVLYQTPDTGKCDELTTIFGQPLPQTSTTEFRYVPIGTTVTGAQTTYVVYMPTTTAAGAAGGASGGQGGGPLAGVAESLGNWRL